MAWITECRKTDGYLLIRLITDLGPLSERALFFGMPSRVGRASQADATRLSGFRNRRSRRRIPYLPTATQRLEQINLADQLVAPVIHQLLLRGQ